MSKKNKNGVDSPKKSSSIKKLTKKDLELLISSLEDKHLRLKAEFDNYRKRKDSEISSLLKYEGKSFIMDFLSILDNISRGIESYKEDDIKKALLLVKDDFIKKLDVKGVKPFGKVGDNFDPELHEALTTTNDPKIDDNYYIYITLLVLVFTLFSSIFPSKKALKLKPDYVDAYYNLGSIVSNLGKSREVRLCSEKIMSLRSWSILGSYSFNREMKLD